MKSRLLVEHLDSLLTRRSRRERHAVHLNCTQPAQLLPCRRSTAGHDGRVANSNSISRFGQLRLLTNRTLTPLPVCCSNQVSGRVIFLLGSRGAAPRRRRTPPTATLACHMPSDTRRDSLSIIRDSSSTQDKASRSADIRRLNGADYRRGDMTDLQRALRVLL